MRVFESQKFPTATTKKAADYLYRLHLPTNLRTCLLLENFSPYTDSQSLV